jgi:hypothetical protein
MERADQVLPSGCVDRHFSADRSVHLRQERRRNLKESDAAQIYSGSKAGKITNHATA